MRRNNHKQPGGEVLDEQTVAQLCEAIAPVCLESELAARMRSRVMAGTTDPMVEVVRAAEGEWRTLLTGVDVKVLHVDHGQRTQTSLWRLAAGARVPAHSHAKDEECLVLEGAVTNDGVTYLPGDYLYARAGTDHSEFACPTGAVLILR